MPESQNRAVAAHLGPVAAQLVSAAVDLKEQPVIAYRTAHLCEAVGVDNLPAPSELVPHPQMRVGVPALKAVAIGSLQRSPTGQ